MGVGERNTVLPSYRGTGVLDELLAYSGAVNIVQELRVVFGCCEPHLLSLYLKMGHRTYTPHNINSPSAGYLIPLVSFVPDAEAFARSRLGDRAGAASRVRGSSAGGDLGSQRGALRTRGLLERDPPHPRRDRRAADLDL